MTRYDDLFEETAAASTVFADKGALDPLAPPEEPIARPAPERELATILHGVHEGYLPTTVSIYGPPGTGKTTLTRQLCQAFAARTDGLAVEYVNLKQCRTIFSAANEILVALGGEKKDAYEGLDGVFEAIWATLATYPAWTVLILDEIDHVRHDANYDVDEFFYRLLRGEGKLARGIDLSAWLISNELLTVDLRVDSRVESAMSDTEVFFPPYDAAELRSILTPRVAAAFQPGALADDALERGVQESAQRWGDARKALRLFRRAGECANDREQSTVTVDCVTASLEDTERAATIKKLQQLPLRHLAVLTASVGRRDANGDIVQPVTTSRIYERLHHAETADRFHVGRRTIQQLVGELETMGLVTTRTESHSREGRTMSIETTFDPEWVRAAQAEVATELGDETAE
jgi:cell division control protein 6